MENGSPVLAHEAFVIAGIFDSKLPASKLWWQSNPVRSLIPKKDEIVFLLMD
jgi:hypothetical protein